MFSFDCTTITDTSVEVQDWYLVITKRGTQSKGWKLAMYEEKTKYKVEDWFFVEVKE